MATNFKSLQLLRNSTIFADKTTALKAFTGEGANTNVSDGSIKLARYYENEGKTQVIKTIFGIYASGTTTFTVYDSAADAEAELLATYNKIVSGENLTGESAAYDNITEIAAELVKLEGASDVTGSIKNQIVTAINKLDVSSTTVDGTNVYVTYKEEDGIVTIENVSLDYATVNRTPTTSDSDSPKTDAALTVANGEKLVIGSDIEKVAQYAADKVKEEADARAKAIADLDVTQIGDNTTYIQSVSETDGKIAAVSGKLDTDAVAFVSTDGEHSALSGAKTATEAFDALEDAIEANKAAELTYKVNKLTDAEISALTDGSNVLEAYRVVSVNTGGTETQVGQTIKIYKDSSLKEADFVNENDKGAKGQFLKLVYILADGSESTVYVDMSQLIVETEVENGIQTVDHKLSIKLDTTGDNNDTGDGKFLTVGADGLKLSGISKAIADAAASAKTEVTSVDSSVTISSSSTADNHVIYDLHVDGATVKTVKAVKSDNDTIISADTTVDDALQNIVNEIVKNEEVAANAIADIQSAVGLDENLGYVPETGDTYVSGASSVADAVHKLNDAIKASDTKNSLTSKNSAIEVGQAVDGTTVRFVLSTDVNTASFLEITQTGGLALKGDLVIDAGTY